MSIREMWSDTMSSPWVYAALLSFILIVINAIAPKDPRLKNLNSQYVEIKQSQDKLAADFSELQQNIIQINKALESSPNLPKKLQWRLETNRLSHQVATTTKKLTDLESAISNNPVKALALPMIKKDLSSLEKKFDRELLQTRLEMNRFYDLLKWFIGILITIIIAIFSIPHIYPKKV